jgi:Fic family protein
VDTARKLTELFARDRKSIAGTGRGASSALRVHHEMQRRPVVTVAWLCGATDLTPPTVAKALEALGGAGVVREVTGRKRNRVFVYDRYLALLNEGTERA